MNVQHIAVVGSGVAGLSAAYVASRTAHVTLYEADDRLGGHADTHLVHETVDGITVEREGVLPSEPSDDQVAVLGFEQA